MVHIWVAGFWVQSPKDEAYASINHGYSCTALLGLPPNFFTFYYNIWLCNLNPDFFSNCAGNLTEMPERLTYVLTIGRPFKLLWKTHKNYVSSLLLDMVDKNSLRFDRWHSSNYESWQLVNNFKILKGTRRYLERVRSWLRKQREPALKTVRFMRYLLTKTAMSCSENHLYKLKKLSVRDAPRLLQKYKKRQMNPEIWPTGQWIQRSDAVSC